VAVVHWGLEYERKPNAEQRRLEQFMRRKGVDIIIGSHPHVVQPYVCDSVQGVTLYSLGNFVSNQRWRYSDGGIVAEVEVVLRDEGRDYALNVEPVWVRKSDYAVLPKSVADTLAMSAEETMAYNLFIADTEALICGE
jgi:poly-gamma-glutamate synthesis protein (capsule biosynthesis protein)